MKNKEIVTYLSTILTVMLLVIILVLTLFIAALNKFSRVESELALIRSNQIPPFQMIYLGKYYTTAYSDRVRETDNSPRTTSIGWHVSRNVIAASQDMFKNGVVKYGDVVYIKELNEIRTIGDTMNRRWKERFDLFYYDRSMADRFDNKKFTYYRVVTK